LKIEETGESAPRNGRPLGVRRLDGALVKPQRAEQPHQSGVQPPHSIAPFQSLSAISKQALTYVETPWAGRWFQRRLIARRLAPVARIAYRRTARVAMTVNGPIRLTIDEDLRATTVHGFDFFGSEPAVPVLPGYAILELKFLRDLPALFKALVEEFALVPEPTSKYRLAVDALRLVASASSTHEVRSSSQGSPLLQPCPNS
jgi:hypothetical protein